MRLVKVTLYGGAEVWLNADMVMAILPCQHTTLEPATDVVMAEGGALTYTLAGDVGEVVTLLQGDVAAISESIDRLRYIAEYWYERWVP